MADITVAASEDAFQEIFNHIRDEFEFDAADSVDFGPFTAGYELDIGLKNGSVDLRDDNTVSVKELDIDVITLRGFIGIDLPDLCIGGFCIIPTPFGCALRAPRFCLFDDDPDIELDLDLGPFLRSEVSFIGGLETKHPPGQWDVHLDVEAVDIDLFDFSDIAGDLLEAAIDAAIDNLLGPLPGWAKDLIKAVLGPVVDLVRVILDLPDDLDEWLSDLFGVSLGLGDLIVQVILDYFADEIPLFSIPDPFPILPPVGGLIPVTVPITDLDIRVTDDEMIVEVELG